MKVISRSSSTDDNLIVRSERIRSLDKLDGRVGYTSYILGSQAKNPSSFFDAFFFLFGFAKAEVSFGHQNIKDLGVPFFSRETSGQTAS